MKIRNSFYFGCFILLISIVFMQDNKSMVYPTHTNLNKSKHLALTAKNFNVAPYHLLSEDYQVIQVVHKKKPKEKTQKKLSWKERRALRKAERKKRSAIRKQNKKDTKGLLYFGYKIFNFLKYVAIVFSVGMLITFSSFAYLIFLGSIFLILLFAVSAKSLKNEKNQSYKNEKNHRKILWACTLLIFGVFIFSIGYFAFLSPLYLIGFIALIKALKAAIKRKNKSK